MDAWLIEEIRRKEERDNRPRLEIPLPLPTEPQENDEEAEKHDVAVIQVW